MSACVYCSGTAWPRPGPVLQSARRHVALDQARQLRLRQPRGALQIAAQQALVRLGQLPVREAPQHPFDMRVSLLALRHQGALWRGAVEELAHSIQAQVSVQIEMQDHPPMIPTPPPGHPSCSFHVGIKPSVHAHLSLEETKSPGSWRTSIQWTQTANGLSLQASGGSPEQADDPQRLQRDCCLY